MNEPAEVVEEEIVEPVEPKIDYEALARKQGWKPEEEFDGEGAVDAKTFVERGERSAAIQKKRREEEKQRTEQRFTKLENTNKKLLKQMADEKDAEISRLEKIIKDGLAKAVKEGDGDSFVSAQEDLEKLKGEREKLQTAQDEETDPNVLPPEVQAAWDTFAEERKWLDRDKKMTHYFNMEASAFRRKYEDGEGNLTLSPTDFWNKLADAVEKDFEYGKKKMPPTEGGKRGNGKKTPTKIADLPQDERDDARKAFDMFKRHNPEYTEEAYVKTYLES